MFFPFTNKFFRVFNFFIWLVYLLDYDLSVAIGVGFIALAGVAAEIGVIMLTYLDQAFHARRDSGTLRTTADLKEAIYNGTAQRVRPISMTVAAITVGLLPIMWGSGTGSEVMKRIAAPMVGGMVSVSLLTLLMIPTIYYFWRCRQLPDSDIT